MHGIEGFKILQLNEHIAEARERVRAFRVRTERDGDNKGTGT
jgi:hypothetical protein